MEKKSYFGNKPRIFRKSLWPTTSHLFASQYLHNQLSRGIKDRKWKIITLIRDPIARNLSAFFQTLELRIPNFYTRYQNKSITLEDLFDIYQNRFSDRFEQFDQPFDWFDLELKHVFGVDVFSEKFPKGKGYKIYEHELADVLLLKLEKIRECSAKAIHEFLNHKGFKLVHANRARDKKYYPIYRKFVNSIVLPEEYNELQYASSHVRHFYSEDEINAFKKTRRSTQKSCESFSG